MFAKDGRCVLSAGKFDYEMIELNLQEGERVLGIKTVAHEPTF